MMKILNFHHAVSFSSCLLLTLAYSYPTQAAPNKDAIDNYARANGFPRSDCPYYEPVNQCGGEGATSAVPNKYEVAINVPAPTLGNPSRTRRVVTFRADFNNACNNHDSCYMTAGRAREDCDAQLNRDLLSACRNLVIPEPASVATCVALAQTYANTVYASGAAFYPNAQAQAQKYNSLVENFAARQASGILSAGLYRMSDGTIISANDSRAFCSFVSPAHFEFISGRYDLVQSIDSSRMSAMANHGACAVRLSAGAYRLVDGRIIASNGSAFCRYTSFEHYERKDRRPIRQFKGEIPLHAMENHFNCAQ